MSSRSSGRLGGDTNPNCDGTEDRFLGLDCFSTFALFILGCFVNLDILETNNVYRCKANLKIPVGKFYDMMDIN